MNMTICCGCWEYVFLASHKLYKYSELKAKAKITDN